MRLTQQTRTLPSEKEDMAKNISLLKDLVQVRELQIVAVTSRLAQLTTGIASMPNLKTEGKHILCCAVPLAQGRCLRECLMETFPQETQADVPLCQSQLEG